MPEKARDFQPDRTRKEAEIARKLRVKNTVFFDSGVKKAPKALKVSFPRSGDCRKEGRP
jgi:hypothetical protein